MAIDVGYTLVGPEYDMSSVFDALSMEEMVSLLAEMVRDGTIETFMDDVGVEQWRLVGA